MGRKGEKEKRKVIGLIWARGANTRHTWAFQFNTQSFPKPSIKCAAFKSHSYHRKQRQSPQVLQTPVSSQVLMW